MWLFDLFSNYGRKLDAIISYDANRNAGKVLITSNIATKLETLEIYLTKENDDDEWVDSFLYSIDYTNEDDDAWEEYKELHLELTPGLPYSIDFSLETIANFTKEKVAIYYEEAQSDWSFEDVEMDGFFDAFLDPKWNLEISIDGATIGEIEFDFEDEGIKEYIHSLKEQNK